MATGTSPPLAQRIITMFVERVEEWLAGQRLVVLGFVSLLVVTYQTAKSIWQRPENEFVSDLVFNTLLMAMVGLLLSISRTISQLQGSGRFADTALGELVFICLEAFFYLSLLVLFAYQTLQLCDSLYRQWEA
jgi:uncharacterized membrane protein